jgi:DNA-binding protein
MVNEMVERSGIVFVGNKMPMDYVLAIITGLDRELKKKLAECKEKQAI